LLPVIAIRAAGPADGAAIEALLQEGHLPLDGLDDALGTAFLAVDGERVVGCAALEIHGRSALLRSVCVRGGRRGQGIGRQLVEESEALARERGIESLYLLTETATGWFPRLGYVSLPRDAAPAELLDSAEFKTACPESAVLMGKPLRGGD
jgi:N-acetylglutamate synthase-like GNAT family acetyltransferase